MNYYRNVKSYGKDKRVEVEFSLLIFINWLGINAPALSQWHVQSRCMFVSSFVFDFFLLKKEIRIDFFNNYDYLIILLIKLIL